MSTLPQEFPRHLALLTLEDVLPDLGPGAREAFETFFEAHRADPLSPRGMVLAGSGGLRPLMALMRLVVLRFRDLNMERFEQFGSQGRYLTAYVKGPNLTLPLPDRANALFIERADQVPLHAGDSLRIFGAPLFATWEGDGTGPVWEAIAARCDVIQV